MTFSGDNLAQFGAAFVQALFNGLWIGAVVALAVFAFVSLNRGLNAASRHAAWYAALIVIAAMPVVSFAVSLAKIDVSATPAEVTIVQPMAQWPSSVDPASQATPPESATSASPSLFSVVSQPVVLERASIVLAVAVAAIAATRIAFLFGGLVSLARVKRASQIVDPSLAPSLARTMARDHRARAVHVRVSESLDAPAAAGFRTPAILLPADLVDSLEAGALDQVAMHEYAHLRRYDDWTNLAHRFIERLFWFSPAIWFVSGRIDLEREIACDDWAVAGAEGVSGYADCLWHLARDGRLPTFAATAPGAFLTRNQIAARIEHLLERHRDSAPTLRTAKLLGIAPVLAASLVLVVGRAPAIAVHVEPAAAAPMVASVYVPFSHVHHATIGVRLIAVSDAAYTSRATTTATNTDRNCPKAKAVHAIAAAVAHVSVAKAIQVAMASQQIAIRQQVQAAMAQVKANASISQTVAHVMHEHQQIIQRTVKAAHADAMMAAAAETDNLSFGPNDRNLLAHCTGCDLSGKDLRNADLHGITLTGDDLSSADLRGANLRGSVLTGVDLSNARLDGADLRGTVFTGSDIDGATFAGAKTDGIRLVGMQLTNSILAGTSARAMLSACAGCDLSGLDLHGRDLHGITFDGADMHGTDLRGANLEGTRFNGVDLTGVKVDGADLRHAEFNGCDLQGVDFTHAQTEGIQLQGSSLGSNSRSSD